MEKKNPYEPLTITSETYFKTEMGSIISWNELKTAVEVVYGNRFDYVVNDFNIYIPDLIKEGYVKVIPVTMKQGYDCALNNDQKIKAILLYWKIKEKEGKPYSIKEAKAHVEEVLERRKKKNQK